MLFLEKESIPALEQIVATFFTKPVPDHIAHYAAKRNQYPENDEIQKITAGSTRNESINEFLTIYACYKQQTVARKKETDHQSGFCKYNKEHHPEAAIINIKLGVQQVPESNCQKSNHIHALTRIINFPITA